MIITSPIEAFFKNPNLEPLPEGDCILFHLRRDLIRLFMARREKPTMMFLCTRCWRWWAYWQESITSRKYIPVTKAREKVERGSSRRSKSYAASLTRTPRQFYQFRCALVHSVSLSTISSSYRRGARFNFDVTDEISQGLVEKLSDSADVVHYRISFWKLKEAFLEIIVNLEKIACDVGHSRNAHVVNMIGQMHSEKIRKS